MSVEFIGMIGTGDTSETRPPAGPIIDPAYVRQFARASGLRSFPSRRLRLLRMDDQLGQLT